MNNYHLPMKNTSNFYAALKVLDELMLELLGKGVAIPAHVTESLKTGRSYSGILRKKPDDGDIIVKTGGALENAEMNLLSLAESAEGREYSEYWQRRVIAAYQEEITDTSVAAPRFVPGLPKGDHKIRMEASYLEEIGYDKQGLESHSLTSVTQEDGYLLIHGKKTDVTAFLEEIRKLVRKKTGKM